MSRYYPPLYIETRTGGQRVWKMDADYLLGSDAAKEGKHLTDNPNQEGSEAHAQWEGGFNNQLNGEHIRYGADATEGAAWFEQRESAIFFPVDEDIPRLKDGRIARGFLEHHMPLSATEEQIRASILRDYGPEELAALDAEEAEHEALEKELEARSNNERSEEENADSDLLELLMADLDAPSPAKFQGREDIDTVEKLLAVEQTVENMKQARAEKDRYSRELIEREVAQAAPKVNEIVRWDGRIARLIGIEFDGREPCYILKFPRPGPVRKSVLTMDVLDFLRDELPEDEYAELDDRLTYQQRCGPVLQLLVDCLDPDLYEYDMGMLMCCLFRSDTIIDYVVFGPFMSRIAEDDFLSKLPPFQALVRLPWDRKIEDASYFWALEVPPDFEERVGTHEMRDSEREKAEERMRTGWRDDLKVDRKRGHG